MAEHQNTISHVAAQLVAAGWHRQDPGADGLYRSRNSDWWCCSTEEGLIDDDGPRTLLTLHRAGDSWSCTVAADQATGFVEDVTAWIEQPCWPQPCCLLTSGWWPGLAPLAAVLDALMVTMPPDAV